MVNKDEYKKLELFSHRRPHVKEKLLQCVTISRLRQRKITKI